MDGDLVVSVDQLPDSLRQSMGAEWRLRNKDRNILEEQSKK